MTTITNDILIKAAKAAGLDVREKLHNGVMLPMFFRPDCGAKFFFPRSNDTDNAMIMDGSEISIGYFIGFDNLPTIEATAHIPGGHPVRHSAKHTDNSEKSQARRDAVILCAAAKFDAMNGGVK